MSSFGAMKDEYQHRLQEDTFGKKGVGLTHEYPGQDREIIEGKYYDQKPSYSHKYEPAQEDYKTFIGEPFESMKEKGDAKKEETLLDSSSSAKVEAFKEFINDVHRSMSYHYSKSKVGDYRRMFDAPEELNANCIDEVIPSNTGIFIVNQNKFSTVQNDIFRRNKKQQKRFLSVGIDYLRDLTDLDFSEISNSDVHKKKSSFWIGDEVKLSPFVLWDKATTSKTASMKVVNSIGFPSINKMTNHKTGDIVNDTIVESGYMVTAMKPEGLRIHGILGGKKGKILNPGQALFFGDAMIRSPGDFMRPVWIRLVSSKPSIKTDDGVSIAEMEAKIIPLKPGSVASELKEFSGTAKRTVKIENNIGSDKSVTSRTVCATMSFKFKH